MVYLLWYGPWYTCTILLNKGETHKEKESYARLIKKKNHMFSHKNQTRVNDVSSYDKYVAEPSEHEHEPNEPNYEWGWRQKIHYTIAPI
jgi:hypothetical protein